MPWASSLLCCLCTDVESCCCSFLCPCIQYGWTSEKLDKDNFCGPCCLYFLCPIAACCFHTPIRGEIRARNGIEGTCCEDCLAVTFCPCCSISQESFQMKKYGKTAPEVGGGKAPVRQGMKF
jgi:Cys-rich protein (TIGR01571 family)